MVDFDEEECPVEWSNIDDPSEEDDSETNPVVGEHSLDRLACALGGQCVLPHIMATIPPMLQNSKNLFKCLLKGSFGWYSMALLISVQNFQTKYL